MRVRKAIHNGAEIDIPEGVCSRCGVDIEWFNGCWWQVGTCRTVCVDMGDHVPVDELVTPDQVEEFLEGPVVWTEARE